MDFENISELLIVMHPFLEDCLRTEPPIGLDPTGSTAKECGIVGIALDPIVDHRQIPLRRHEILPIVRETVETDVAEIRFDRTIMDGNHIIDPIVGRSQTRVADPQSVGMALITVDPVLAIVEMKREADEILFPIRRGAARESIDSHGPSGQCRGESSVMIKGILIDLNVQDPREFLP
jgi:hypothetical protein